MGKRRTRDQIQRLLREADRDLAKGLTVGDLCRKLGLSQNAYYRWRKLFEPAKGDDSRRVRELEGEVERLKRLVAERLLDKQMLQDIAKKSGNALPAAGG
jgi:putative transposase